MSLKDRLINNRRALGIPEPEPLPLAQLDSSKVAAILTSVMPLLDEIAFLNRHSSDTELSAIKNLAGTVESAIIKAVLTTESTEALVDAHGPTA